MSNLKPISLPPIPMKNSLKTVILRSNLKTAIVEDIKNKGFVSTMAELKLHPDLVKYICVLVENSIHNNKKKKIDKKQLVIDVLSDLFALSVPDKEVISKAIDHLIQTNRIKKKTLKLFVGGLVRTVRVFLNII